MVLHAAFHPTEGNRSKCDSASAKCTGAQRFRPLSPRAGRGLG
ncbi:hypothetical protein SAMCFNEI73_Ch2691 [Sinorhizobium americanum]|uniref:Uncharacterized protein n=1 Tax=Sinorhizobium americanum TaxID=194963 RepID=A0A1L3LPG6_9HYPH|nr:hypothetical protein SAMCFNEI73_Ch2691 [Sinorhizobium americanum]